MKYYKYKITFFYIHLIFYASINAQISYSNIQDNQLELSFLFDKIEAEAHQSIFNVLRIVNRSNLPYSGTLDISVPREWHVIGENESKISIPPNDSVSIPLRVSVSKNALGEIGYSVMATLTHSNGTNNSISGYFYVTIPRKTDLSSSPDKYIYYIPEYQTKTSFNYEIENKGNVQELVHLEMKTNNNIYINDDKRGLYIDEFALKPNSDTSLKISIFNKLDEESRQYNRLDIKSSNNDTVFYHTIWFKVLKDNYTYKIPENQKCAIIELNGYNLLSKEKPNYTLMAKGAILLKNSKEFYFYSYNNFREKSYIGRDIGYFNNTYVGFKTGISDTRIGNVQGSYEQSINGLGIDAKLNLGVLNFKATYLEGIYSEYIGYGGSVNFNNKIANLTVGSVFSDNNTYSLQTKLAFGGIAFGFLKYNSLSIIIGGSEFIAEDTTSFRGYGITANYDFRTKKFVFQSRLRFGSPYYTGASAGRLDIKSTARYTLKDNAYLIGNYEKLNFDYFNYLQYNNTDYRKSYSDRLDIGYLKVPNENLSYRIGVISKFESINNLFTINPDSFFTILSAGSYLEANIRFKNTNFLPRIEFLRSYYLPRGMDSLQFNIGYNSVNISANISVKDFGVYSLFKYGANSIFEHFLYQNNGTIAKWLFIMPYYKKYFFKKSVLLDVRGNYMANINNNEKTFNINTQLFWYLPYDFTIRFQNSIYNRSRIDLQTNIKYTYSNIYFEAGIRKEFNCNQPRMQYHDLKVVFYRDINGDHVKNDNEPGIVNVLAEIKWDFDEKNDRFSNFNDMQFLSDESGSIEYTNIQNGFYVIKYQILDEVAGNFSLEQLSYNFEMEKDKVIYIPYHENNKIIGKIVMNRDPLSSLGPLDISNIRVVAEDTKGHSYSALSDKEGNFVLYTPQADHYVVKINNVFYESFDLQQSEFIVKFNGFKQFEITFVFNEKKRKINFSNDVKDDKNEVLDDLQLIKKTTLTGKIRDAVSLEPIEAKIEIIDNRNNKVVSSAISNKLNGNYSISYVAGENLRIEVKSEGHWDHVENLYIEQVISIQNIAKDIILNKLSDGPKEQTFIIYDKKEQEKFKENFKPGQKIPVNNLNFDEKETRLSPNAYPDLDVLIDLLKKNSTIKIEIAGHADDTGNERPDNILSLRRAKSVARYLTEHGIAENRIEVNSYSNTRPLVPSTNDKARKRNRRVEIIVK